jgi:hypothetical protein
MSNAYGGANFLAFATGERMGTFLHPRCFMRLMGQGCSVRLPYYGLR